MFIACSRRIRVLNTCIFLCIPYMTDISFQITFEKLINCLSLPDQYGMLNKAQTEFLSVNQGLLEKILQRLSEFSAFPKLTATSTLHSLYSRQTCFGIAECTMENSHTGMLHFSGT